MGRQGVEISAEKLRAAEHLVKKSIDTEEIIRSTSDGDRFSDYLRLVIAKASGHTSDLSLDLQELHDYNSRWNLWEDVPADVLPTLAQLRSLGLKLVVLSNSNGTLKQSFERLGLHNAVDLIFDSHEEGLEKPDPEYFLRALKASGGTAATTVHVGDFYQIDVMGARSAGIDAILLDAANLYEGSDCVRIRSMSGLIASLMPRLSA